MPEYPRVVHGGAIEYSYSLWLSIHYNYRLLAPFCASSVRANYLFDVEGDGDIITVKYSQEFNTMKNTSAKILAAFSVIALSVALFAPPVVAAPLDPQEYVILNSSVRNRAKGEKRFTDILSVAYGDPEQLKVIFGKRGPNPFQRISFRNKNSTITFRGRGNGNVQSIDFRPNAQAGQPVLVTLLNGARCRIGSGEFETCQVEVRVIRGKSSITNRITASGSNGASYDSGPQDVQISFVYAPKI